MRPTPAPHAGPRHLPRPLRILSAALALAAAGCGGAAAEEGPPPRHAALAEYVRPDSIPFPGDNAPGAAREALGKMLFFDPRLSASQTVSCGTCHNPGFHWGDGLPRGVGDKMKVLNRRTPTVLNVAWAAALFWDGRAETLEEQALLPIASADEMNMDMDSLIGRLRSVPGYPPLFEAAYPGEGITPSTLGKALAAYQRTIVSGDAPFDAWVRGDTSAISPQAQLGFRVFTGKAGCDVCHGGWRFTDDSFHDIGLPGTDRGRGAVLDLDVVQFAFKTPTLRNVAERSPYMHDGSVATLEEVVELYDRGGQVRRPGLSPEIRPLRLTADEKRALVAYLRTLSSADAPVAFPVLPR